MRIILADHHPWPLKALKMMLQEEPTLEIVGEAEEAEDLFSLAECTSPDLVLVDEKLPGGHIKDLLSILGNLKPKPFIIVMSTSSVNSRMILMSGADAIVSKGDSPEWLLDTLHHYASKVG